jgi:GTP-binding protein EngB required for normal cell division
MFQDKLNELVNKHLMPVVTTVPVTATSHPLDDGKAMVKYWLEHRQRLSSFACENMIDVLFIGTQASGKSTWLNLLCNNHALSTGKHSDTNDIFESAVDQFRVKVREVSYSYVKSWYTYIQDARIVVLVIDGSSLHDFAIAYVHLLSVLHRFDRPCVLLVNKLDTLDKTYDVETLLQTGQLLAEHPQLTILAMSAFSHAHVAAFRDVLKQLLQLFGCETDPKQKDKPKYRLCC